MKKEKLLPDYIDNEEKIARIIYSPTHLNGKKTKINPSAFKSPPEMDEVSVNRLSYTTPDFCKQIGKKYQKPENKRAYFGLGILKANEIRDAKAEVIYTPILEPEEDKNIYHADIKIGYIKKRGEQLPAEINHKIQEIISKVQLYEDTKPDSNEWCGNKDI